MMVQRQAQIIFEAEQPIAHHAGTDGNKAHLMTRKIRRREGGFDDIPEITGGSMRNRLRYASSMALLRAAGMLDECLTEGAIHLLFAGGRLTGRGDASVINLDRFRELCALCPPIALLGGCSDSRVVPGKTWVEPATLICRETLRHLPPWALRWCAGDEPTDDATTDTNESAAAERFDYAAEHIEDVMRVHMDPMLNPGLRTLLLPEAQIAANTKLQLAEAAHTADDAVGKSKEKSAMMPFEFERIAQGSLFFWRATVTCHNPLEEDTFNMILAELLAAGPRVGGKQGTGHGLMRAVVGRGVEFSRTAERTEDLSAMVAASRPGDIFRAHVAERKEQIQRFFREVVA